jgi:hypothetical protein
LKLVMDFATKQDQLDEALSCVKRARALKPLDPALREREATIYIGLARQCAIARRWDEGREQFRAAEAIKPDLRQDFPFLARKVIFEAKAGNRDESDRFLQEAQAALSEPTALWLSLAIESGRYRMTAATTKGYQKLWTDGLKKACQSQSAGDMAWLLYAYIQSEVTYSGRSDHVKRLEAYLKRARRLKFRQIDIERVCAFLALVENQDAQDLLRDFIKNGLKQHPLSAQLNFAAGIQAMADSPPPFLSPLVPRHIEKAFELAQGSTSPADMALLPKIKDALTMINEIGERLASMPFGNGSFGFDPSACGPDENWGFDGFDDDLSDVIDMFGPTPRTLPQHRPKKQGKSRKR